MHKTDIEFNENWSRWEPLGSSIDGKYDIHKVLYNYDNFTIILKGRIQQNFVEITFIQTVSAIRIASESVVFTLFDKLYAKYGKDFYTQWPLFKVQNSDCLKWLENGTAGASELYDLTHYVITDLDMVIDVVTHNEPVVKILEYCDSK